LLFSGFLGLCTLLLLWPGLVILHVTKVEELVWPDSLEWAVLFVSGIVGVVISNLLWLWLVVVASNYFSFVSSGSAICSHPHGSVSVITQ